MAVLPALLHDLAVADPGLIDRIERRVCQQDAYVRMGREEAWTLYLGRLRENHSRKRKLMGLLKERW